MWRTLKKEEQVGQEEKEQEETATWGNWVLRFLGPPLNHYIIIIFFSSTVV
jgi:hypothetical protein